MVLPPNRLGGTRGPNATTLDDLLAALDLLRTAVIGQGAVLGSILTELQNQGEAQGAPALTDCNLTMLELLCSINTALVGGAGEIPTTPAFRCGNLFNGGYVQAIDWTPMVDFPGFGGAATLAHRAVWGSPTPECESEVLTVVLPEVGNPVEVIRSPVIGRETVCVSALKGDNVFAFNFRRYTYPGLAYVDEGFLGSPSYENVWTTGSQFGVDTEFCYVIFAVVNEGETAPDPDTYLWWTEGALA